MGEDLEQGKTEDMESGLMQIEIAVDSGGKMYLVLSPDEAKERWLPSKDYVKIIADRTVTSETVTPSLTQAPAQTPTSTPAANSSLTPTPFPLLREGKETDFFIPIRSMRDVIREVRGILTIKHTSNATLPAQEPGSEFELLLSTQLKADEQVLNEVELELILGMSIDYFDKASINNEMNSTIIIPPETPP